MVNRAATSTQEEFSAFVNQPEHADRRFELIHGEIVEMSPGRTSNSELGLLLAVVVVNFCRAHGLPCHISGADGAYAVDEHIVAPDFAYKITPMSDDYPDGDPPLWVVEIISPSDKAQDVQAKRGIYQRAGITLWEVYPRTQTVSVYTPDQPDAHYGIDATLTIEHLLPAFALKVRDLLRDSGA